MKNSNLYHIINYYYIQSITKPYNMRGKKQLRKKNTVKYTKALTKLYLYAVKVREANTRVQVVREGKKSKVTEKMSLQDI